MVDDGSVDTTPDLLDSIADPRLTVVRNDRPAGLASALNRGFELARGRYVARLDADDIALPTRFERQLARVRADPGVGIVGTGAMELWPDGRLGAVHLLPDSPASVRWHALFSAPFFHPTVLVDRELLRDHGLSYDPAYAESEDYELWSRLLKVADGTNIAEPLVLYRRHPGQASERRGDLQRSFQQRVALCSIRALAPRLTDDEAELAWRLGSGERVAPKDIEASVHAYLALLEQFEAANGVRRAVRSVAARVIVREALRATSDTRTRLLRQGLTLDPALVARTSLTRIRRRLHGSTVRREVTGLLPTLLTGRAESHPTRVVVVSPEPTPFRSLHFDRLAQRPEVDLSVVYSGHTIFSRTWTIRHHHPTVFLRGLRVPFARRVLRHDYPITLAIFAALREARPDVVVVSGWSTFASQTAVLWSRARHVPYVLLVESNDRDSRPGWRRVVKDAVVPRLVRHADRVLVIGSLARESVLARGASPERVSWFANTVDAAAWAEQADRLAGRRPELRTALGVQEGDVVLLSVARLSPEKGLDTLVRAAAQAGDSRVVIVALGEGPERARLQELGRRLGVRLILAGSLPWERMVEAYVAADVFALLSLHEPWGVVVNEAAACGLPLLLSDRVGAAADLLVDGENGFRVVAGDVEGTAAAIRRLAADHALRVAAGVRSRELMGGWGYEPSIDSFIAAVRAAAAQERF